MDDQQPLPGSSDRLGLAIVGLNFGAHVLEKEWQDGPAKPYFDLRCVCDLRSALSDEVAQRYGVSACYDLEEVLEDPTVDVVGLFTRPQGRPGMIRRIIRAGKHVMTTKPFALDSEAASDVLEEARQLGRHVYLNSPGPALPDDLQTVRSWGATHNLGRPLAARWATWVNYREVPDGSWYDDPALCPSPPLLRLGIYGMNELAQLFLPHETAEAVQIMQSRLFTQRPTTDHASLNVQFSEGGLGSVFASFCVDDGLKYPDHLTLHFERGTVFRRDVLDVDVPQAQQRVELVMEKAGKPTVVQAAEFAKPLGAFYPWKALHAAILGDEEPPADYAQRILEGVRILEAMKNAELHQCQAQVRR